MLGMFMLMIGNGLQGNTLALRAEAEGFDQVIMGFVMSGYFAGFFIGAKITTTLIKRVGHVRVFAALASLISAAFIIFPLFPNPYVWILSRIVIGLSFAGVYIVTESWLNNSAENEQRAKVLSAYSMVQMLGLITSGWLVLAGSPEGYELFVLMSILVSLSFAPILLSTEKAPVFETTSPLSLREMFKASPLGVVTLFATGGLFALQFTMVGQYTVAKGLSKTDLATIFSAIYIGGMLLQMPIGVVADKFDRRLVIVAMCTLAAVALSIGVFFTNSLIALLFMSFIVGGINNPLYSVAVAYVNDRVAYEQMAAASAGVMFVNGLGAIGMPILAGFMMQNFGADVFWIMFIVLFASLGIFGVYRMSVRVAVSEDDTSVYAPVAPTASPVFMEATQEIVVDQMDAQLEAGESGFVRFDPQELLDFWLEEIGPENWYKQSDEVDADIRERYNTLHRRLSDGQYGDWLETPEGALATIIVLDQFSRNLYRNDARAFENDQRAREIAKVAIEKGFDEKFDRDLRQFFFLPFAHSEILSDQDFAIEGAHKAKLKGNILDFKVHRAIIAEFGRFPYRNQALDRTNTEAEQAFIDSGGYGKLRKQIAQKRDASS